MKRQFKGIKWIKNEPYFLLFDTDKKKMEIKKSIGYIKIKITDERKCNGYYDLLARKYKPCIKIDVEISETHQCDYCKNQSGFYECLRCDGKMCISKNPIAKEFCNQKHVVYIALFGNEKFKVGTAAEYRKYARIEEQGAIASMFIAMTSTGKIARFIESYISTLGFTLQVNSNFKINNLIIEKDKSQINEILKNKYNEIKKKMPEPLKKYLIEPEINYFENINEINKRILMKEETTQLSLFNDEKIIKTYDICLKPTLIIGTIKNVVGTIVIVENQGIHVYDTKKIEGYIVEIN